MTLILNKGQQTTVRKENGGAPVMNITVGVSWGKINRMSVPKTGVGFFDKLVGKAGAVAGTLEDVDLDLSILMFDARGQLVDECAFYHKQALNQSVLHSGDDRGGDAEDDGLDNERIQFKGLEVAKTNVASAFIVLNSYTHQKFDEIPHIRLGLYDGLYGLRDKAARLQEFDLTNDKMFVGAEAVILARLDKTPGGWAITAIGQPTADSSIAALRTRIQSEHI